VRLAQGLGIRPQDALLKEVIWSHVPDVDQVAFEVVPMARPQARVAQRRLAQTPSNVEHAFHFPLGQRAPFP